MVSKLNPTLAAYWISIVTYTYITFLKGNCKQVPLFSPCIKGFILWVSGGSFFPTSYQLPNFLSNQNKTKQKTSFPHS